MHCYGVCIKWGSLKIFVNKKALRKKSKLRTDNLMVYSTCHWTKVYS